MVSVAVAMLTVMLVILYAATRDRPLSTVPAPRPVARSDATRQPENLWIRDYMQQHGSGDELKARQSRINRFRTAGEAATNR
jgi:hypothetical protein